MQEHRPSIAAPPVAGQVGAWFVHGLTASGAVVGLLALIAINDGRYIMAFAWMGVTLAIDAVDGTLARIFKVKHYVPQIDGALLDNITDYFTYVIVPAYFIYSAGLVPGAMGIASALAITLASAYQFCQTDAKTDDHYFKGFPSHWNVVVFYLFFLQLPCVINFVVILVLAVAVFVPIKYIYPSRTRAFRGLTLVLSAAWGIILLVFLLGYPTVSMPLLYVSLGYVAYYFATSFYISWRDWRSLRRVAEIRSA